MMLPKNIKYVLSHKHFVNTFLLSTCSLHTPVMVSEVLNYIDPQKNNLFIDMTFGAGGHTKELLKREPSLRIICLDRDPHAYRHAKDLSEKFPGRVIPCLGKFSELPDILKNLNISKNSVDGMLFDFGCSSVQLDTAARGFSISNNGPLDMRMDADRFPNSPTALDVLKKADELDLTKIFKIYGEEKMAKKVARAIVESRYTFKTLKTCQDLATLVAEACDTDKRVDKLRRPSHIATKVFQALRIFVNNELNEINYGMVLANWYLKVGGRLVTLSFHSLEDRIVKQHLTGTVEKSNRTQETLHYSSHTLTHDSLIMENVKDTNWLPLNKHVVVPSAEEVEVNPRSRSAKLRAAVKIK